MNPENDNPPKSGFDILRGILKERTKGEFDTWHFVALFMEMIDEAEKQSAPPTTPGATGSKVIDETLTEMEWAEQVATLRDALDRVTEERDEARSSKSTGESLKNSMRHNSTIMETNGRLIAERDTLAAQLAAVRDELEEVVRADDAAMDAMRGMGLTVEPETRAITDKCRAALAITGPTLVNEKTNETP